MTLVGFLAFHRARGDEAFVDYVCTAKSHRRRGVARSLMSSMNAKRVTLITSACSRQHSFYTHLGFEPTFDCSYEAGVGEICLHGQLKASPLAIDSLSFEQLPWDEVNTLLRSNGLRTRGIRRLLQPNDSRVEYRLLYADQL